MGIQHKLLCDTGIEVAVPMRSVRKGNHGGIHYPGYREAIVENCLHKMAIVFQHRRLTSVEPVRFSPSKSEAHFQVSQLCCLILRPWIFGHIQPRNADSARGTDDGHQRVQHRRRCFFAVHSLGAGFKPDRIYGGINLRLPNDLGNQIPEVVALG